MGNILTATVHAANIHDTVAGCAVFRWALWKYPSLCGCCGDAGYRKTFEEFVQSLGRNVDISEKIKPHEWEILPKRWRVERTFSWLNNSHRLSKDYEINTDTEVNFIYLSHIATLLRRLYRKKL